jgi:dihydrolipoamide dehydrogenase
MYDVIILGAGPAGYTAALRSGQLGMKTLLIEPGKVGGKGLHAGVMPSKGMLENARFYRRVESASHFGVEGINPQNLRFSLSTAMQRTAQVAERMARGIEERLRQRGVDILRAHASLVSATSVSVENRELEAAHIILATGSQTRELPFDMPAERTATAWTALSRPEVPKNAVVLGATPVAVEYAQLFSMLGAGVTIATAYPTLLPMLGYRLREAVSERLLEAGVRVVTEAGSYTYGRGTLRMGTETAACDLLVNCTAERAVMPETTLSFTMNGPFVQVDDYLRTSEETVYAVGNVNGLVPTARSASAQGLYAVNRIAGLKQAWDPAAEPVIVYGEPELAQVGRTESELEAEGIDYRAVEAPLSDNGKALLAGVGDGFVRILFERQYGEVLGVQIFADNASDLVGEASALIEFEGTVYDVARTAHAHPAVSEVFMELGKTATEELE